MPRALVTGLAGQTGSYLAGDLATRGWDVHGVARSSDPRATDDSPMVAVHNLDITDGPTLDRLIREIEPDAVFNLAAISSVAESWKSPTEVARVNALPVATMLATLDSVREQTGRTIAFVQASSAEIFGHPSSSPQDEATPVAPRNPYGASKAYAHQLVGIYREKGIPASSCILYNHESPRRPPAFVTRKITQGAARIAAGIDDSLVLGNLDAQRDWGWAPDYARALVLAAEYQGGGDFVIATGARHSIRDFVTTAFTVAGLPDWERYVTTSAEFMRPTDAPLLVGDSSKARAELGWMPTVSFDEIVSTMVDNDLQLIRETNNGASKAG